MRAELDSAGFVLVPQLVDELARAELLRSIEPALRVSSVRHHSGGAIAARGLLAKVLTLPAVLASCGVTALASHLLGDAAFPVDAIYFDKHSGANWSVPGHQDRIIAVNDASPRKDRIRDGIAYAEPSASVLARLVALRIHFDAADSDTGALGLVRGSHRAGILTTEQILELSLDDYQPCPAEPGDVLALRPLLLHRSSPSRSEGHRRVLHVVYAAGPLDEDLEWRHV